jgi:transposase
MSVRTTPVSRAEAIGLARRSRALDSDLAANRTALTAAVTERAPELLKVRGFGPVVAATALHAWSHPGRIHSEAAFAALAGVSPLPASSGNTRRHRLNRGGDGRLNRYISRELFRLLTATQPRPITT